MEEKNNLTAERSLEIIRESIERSQRTINKNSAMPLIWWDFVWSYSHCSSPTYGKIMADRYGICFGPHYG